MQLKKATVFKDNVLYIGKYPDAVFSQILVSDLKKNTFTKSLPYFQKAKEHI